MTVQDLIDALRTMPPDMEVAARGCDCWVDITGVEVLTAGTSWAPAGSIEGPAVLLLSE